MKIGKKEYVDQSGIFEKMKKFTERHNKFQDYYQRLGEFINKFSNLEAMLRIYLIERLGVDLRIGKAIFADYGVNQSLDTIRKFHEAQNEEIHPHLARLIKQVDLLRLDRNRIVHGETFLIEEEDVFLSTNRRFTYSKKKVREVKLETNDLFMMTMDVEYICKVIQVHIDRDELSDKEFNIATSLDEFPEWHYLKNN